MIVQLDRSAVNALDEHLQRHWEENLTDNFMVPQSLDALWESFDSDLWTFDPATGGLWQRVWAYRDGTDIRAHVAVTGNALVPWRCTLGMGVERSHRGQGIGRELMNVALRWVRESAPSVEWVDGYALADNAPVLALDYSVGFVEVGRVPDVARFGDHSADQLILTLKVVR